MRSRWPRALRTVATYSALPYGYTLTVWSSGAVLMHRHGPPTIGDVLLFIGGAGVAFMVLALLAGLVGGDPFEPTPGRFERVGALNVACTLAGVGLVVALAGIPGHLAWPLGAFAGTLAYLLLASVATALEPA